VITYKDWAPTQFDRKGAYLREQQDWFVVGLIQTRDSGPLDQSNFAAALKLLGGESETVNVCRFGHWGPGWFEIILVAPGSDAVKIAEGIETRLADYPVLDEEDHSRREQEAADETWRNCYREKERIEYIWKHRSQFEFHDLGELLANVRGKHFSGYASELIN
jgi:hypothetical protein